jgi:predicted RNase H-like nuclease (RuvC/YqgF family)
MSKEYDPNDAVEFIFKKAGSYAKAKGQLAELETYKSSLKAIQMAKSGESSLGAQEREAYRSPEYQELCKAIGAATEEVEKLRWELEAAKMRWETWRTQQATNRQVERMLG